MFERSATNVQNMWLTMHITYDQINIVHRYRMSSIQVLTRPRPCLASKIRRVQGGIAIDCTEFLLGEMKIF